MPCAWWVAIAAVCGTVLAQEGPPAPYRDVRKAPLSYNGPGREEAEPKDATEVRIGYFGPADPEDNAGGQQWMGASLAIEEANRQGGYHKLPFRLLSAWDKNPWTGGVAKLARMVYGDGVWAIVGGIDGATTHLAEQVVAKAQLALVNPAATDRSIHTASVPWMFTCTPGDRRIAEAMVAKLRETGGRFAILSAIDHDSRALVGQLKQELAKERMAPALHQEWSGAPEDMPRMAREVAALEVAAVVVIADAGGSAAMVGALREAGYRGATMGGPAVGRMDGDPKVDGVWYPVLGEIPAEFAAKFRARWGKAPDFTAAFAYDAATLVVAAVRNGGMNRARIGDALRALSPAKGVTGEIAWDPVGQNDRPVGMRKTGPAQ
jgi:branched-chain amino acid transport system substrate-binding protein